ncbi:MAG: hypothetical protein H6619_06385 [Deltaproteobacteria bacterium]|nr:hypothetical protein [Deltaproteobacteria bacterium]
MNEFGRVVLLGAPPATGKSTVATELAEELLECTGRPWRTIDNETLFTPQARVIFAEASGLELGSPEFARTFNRHMQLCHQEMCRLVASHGVNVVMQGPFEDLTCEVDGEPLWLKMVNHDFKGFGLIGVYMLLWPENNPEITSTGILKCEDFIPVEREIQARLQKRGEGNQIQTTLDADKHEPDYYRVRAKKVLHTAETFRIPVVRQRWTDASQDVIEELTNAILEQL